MQIAARERALEKRHPLTISRGTSSASLNLFVTVSHDGVEGLGELSPSAVTGDSAETGQKDLAALRPMLEDVAPWEREKIEGVLRAAPSAATGLGGVGGGRALHAAIEMACWDWLGKRAGLPVWKLLGLSLERIAPTSVTVGINPPDVAAEQAREWQVRTQARCLKLKLGAPDGVEADQAMYEAVRQAALPGTVLRVDANGGWSVAEAQQMLPWLAARGVEYVEQPLAQGEEESLAALRPAPVPIFLDETVRVASDVPKVASACDGVNVKLMKCGGLAEAMRIVAVARAHGLATMLGCMSETSLAISAGAQIGPLFDHLDLDSHLNLKADPFHGARWHEGRVIPLDAPGLGVQEGV